MRWKREFVKVAGEGAERELVFTAGESVKIADGIVVDTCGVHTPIRELFGESSQLFVLPYVVFRGKRKLSAQDFKYLYQPAFGLETVIRTKVSEAVLELALNGQSQDYSDLSYVYSRPSRPEDHLLFLQRDGINKAGILPHVYNEEISKLELMSPFKEIFDIEMMWGDRILHWLMRASLVEIEELERLATGGMVMIGDAAHSLPILGGEGANFAIQDAMKLAEALEGGVENVGKFYKAQHGGWKAAIRDADKRLVMMHETEKIL